MLRPLTPVEFLRSLSRILRGRPQIPLSLADNVLLQRILTRRSVRSFTNTPVPDDVFAAILEAGRVAPSTVNLQTWSFAVFTAAEWHARFGAHIPFGAQRGVIVMADTNRARSAIELFPESPLVEYTLGVMNASLAAMCMNLAAEALGVSSVMLSETGRTGMLDAAHLRSVLELPDRVVPIMTIVFGYRRGPLPPMPPKLPLAEITFRDRYEQPDPAAVQDWVSQMMAGYAASNPGSSLEKQLRVYQAKIGDAERELQRAVFGEHKD